jgi:methylated-DNA-protein-cysteine methyltransferase-like protein
MNRDKNDFFEDVYAVVRLIPYGRVTSYGAIARYLGTGRSSRMVGWAMNNSHGLEIPVPAHRVVNRLGLLTGKAHFGDEKAMQRLLEAEGVRIEHDRVVDFEQLYWDPLREIQY